MDTEDLVILAGAGYLYLSDLQEMEQAEESRRKHRFWERDVIKGRKKFGHYTTLTKELIESDDEWFYNYTRMNKDQFNWILEKLRPRLQRVYQVREPLSPELRLYVALRYLAAGDETFTLASNYRIGICTVPRIVKEVSDLIWEVLYDYAFPRNDEATWMQISQDFEKLWDFPHTCGAIDGKHIRIKAPKNSGSSFYNYKGYYSTVLLGVVDAYYRFVYVNVGSFGQNSDAGILASSGFGQMLDKNTINFPPPAPLRENEPAIPYFLVGDEAFGLKPWCMTPFSGRFLEDELSNFNQRLSRARRVVENAFGILAARWRIFHKPIHANPENVDSFVKATLVLHNLLCGSNVNSYKRSSRVLHNDYIRNDWRRDADRSIIDQIPPELMDTGNPRGDALQVRDYLKNYINSGY